MTAIDTDLIAADMAARMSDDALSANLSSFSQSLASPMTDDARKVALSMVKAIINEQQARAAAPK